MANKLISVNTWESKAWQKKKRQIREGFFRGKKQQQKEKKIKKKNDGRLTDYLNAHSRAL